MVRPSFFAAGLIALALSVSPAVAQTFNPACFTIGSEPILRTGSLRDGATWNDPTVLHDGRQFVMWASADTNFDQHILIYRLVSPDGVEWKLEPAEPVFAPTEDAWDAKSVETPSVVRFKGKYYLFYVGYPDSQGDIKSYKIGYAESDDGIHWRKHPEPIIAPSNPDAWFPDMAFDQYVVGEPGAVVAGGRLLVYYTAIGADDFRQGILQSIGMIATEDGINWTKPAQVLKPDESVYGAKNNIKGFSTPSAAVLDGQVHLFVDVATEEPFSQIALHHAYSADGVTGWRQDNGPFLKREALVWTGDNLQSPHVLRVGGDTHLWFSGNYQARLGIGHGLCRQQSADIAEKTHR